MGEASPAPAVPSGVVTRCASQGDGASTLSGGCAGGRALGSRVGDVERWGRVRAPRGVEPRRSDAGMGEGVGGVALVRAWVRPPFRAGPSTGPGVGGAPGGPSGARERRARGSLRRRAERTQPPSGRNGAGRAGPRRIARGSRGVNTTGNGPWVGAGPRPWGGLPAAGAWATRFLAGGPAWRRPQNRCDRWAPGALRARSGSLGARPERL